MNYSELFDGEEHWLELDCGEGWRLPYMQVTDVVELEPQPVPIELYESPLTNLVSSPSPSPAQRSWAVEDGWSAFAVMSQYIGDLLSPTDTNLLEVDQRVVRNETTWAIVSSHYRVIWKGDDVEC